MKLLSLTLAILVAVPALALNRIRQTDWSAETSPDFVVIYSDLELESQILTNLSPAEYQQTQAFRTNLQKPCSSATTDIVETWCNLNRENRVQLRKIDQAKLRN